HPSCTSGTSPPLLGLASRCGCGAPFRRSTGRPRGAAVMARRVKVEVARKGAGLSSLEPIDASPFRMAASPGFLWFTVVAFWMFSLLPWRTWDPAPDLLLLVIAYWSLNEPRRVGMVTAFFFGILMDVHD